VGENTSMGAMAIRYTIKDWGVRNYTQVSVQTGKTERLLRSSSFTEVEGIGEM
jgi:hypothetical protein